MKTLIVALYPYNAQQLEAWLDHGSGMTYTAAREQGCNVDFLDMKSCNNDNELRERIKGHDLVSFGLKSSYYAIGMKVIRMAKEQGSKVLVGGYHATAAPQELLDNPDIDWVFHGESEITFPKFLKNSQSFPREIFGEKPENLDKLPFMDRTMYREPVENCLGWWHGGVRARMVTVMAARGCPFKCGFCQPLENNHFGKKLRRRSVDSLIAELKVLKETYHPDCVMIHDDTFLIQPKWIEEFIEKYPEIGLPFWAAGRADGICQYPELVKKLVNVGWELVSVGFESGSQKILDLIKKETTVEQNLEAARIIKSTGAKIYGNYMLGLPWETKEDIQATARMVDVIGAEMPSWAYFTPYPGCELGEECIQKGWSLLDRNHYDRCPSGKKVKNVDYEYVDAVLKGLRENRKITAITLTGDRPLPFDLCRQWISAQTVKPDQWIIVDDGKLPMKVNGLPAYAEYVRREPQRSDPQHTMILNLKEALKKVTGEYIIILEDDEYYAPAYIEEMVKRLNQHEVVGIGNSKYYHIAGGYFTNENMNHASFAQTAFRNNKIPVLEATFNGDCFVDIRFWKKANGFVFDDGEENPLYVGIKGLPGRPGIGNGHLFDNNYKKDTDHKILKKWIPKDYMSYLDILKRSNSGEIIINTNKGGYVKTFRAIKQGGFIPVNCPHESSVHGFIKPGTVFSFEGPVGTWMQPIEDPEKKVIPVEELPFYKAAEKKVESHGLPSLESTPLDSKPVKKGKRK